MKSTPFLFQKKISINTSKLKKGVGKEHYGNAKKAKGRHSMAEASP